MTSLPLEKLIQRQIHQWNRYRELLESVERPEEVKSKPIITISREKGAGARELAQAIAQRLDLEVHGASLIDEIARDTNLEREVIEHLDEQARSQVDLWIKGVLQQRIFLRDNYHVSLVRTVRTLAAHGGVIFLGRGANIILEDRCDLRILLIASVESRVRDFAQREGITSEEARSRIADLDAGRQRFLQKLFHVEANDPHLYDLVLNSETLPLSRLVEVVMTALEVRGVFSR